MKKYLFYFMCLVLSLESSEMPNFIKDIKTEIKNPFALRDPFKIKVLIKRSSGKIV